MDKRSKEAENNLWNNSLNMEYEGDAYWRGEANRYPNEMKPSLDFEERMEDDLLEEDIDDTFEGHEH